MVYNYGFITRLSARTCWMRKTRPSGSCLGLGRSCGSCRLLWVGSEQGAVVFAPPLLGAEAVPLNPQGLLLDDVQQSQPNSRVRSLAMDWIHIPAWVHAIHELASGCVLDAGQEVACCNHLYPIGEVRWAARRAFKSARSASIFLQAWENHWFVDFIVGRKKKFIKKWSYQGKIIALKKDRWFHCFNAHLWLNYAQKVVLLKWKAFIKGVCVLCTVYSFTPCGLNLCQIGQQFLSVVDISKVWGKWYGLADYLLFHS